MTTIIFIILKHSLNHTSPPFKPSSIIPHGSESNTYSSAGHSRPQWSPVAPQNLHYPPHISTQAPHDPTSHLQNSLYTWLLPCTQLNLLKPYPSSRVCVNHCFLKETSLHLPRIFYFPEPNYLSPLPQSSLNQHLLGLVSVPGTVLGTRNTGLSKTSLTPQSAQRSLNFSVLLWNLHSVPHDKQQEHCSIKVLEHDS